MFELTSWFSFREVFENLTDKDHSIDGDTSIASSDSTIVPAVSSLVNLGKVVILLASSLQQQKFRDAASFKS